MRGDFLDKIFQKMETDDTLFFLTADMGINLVEKFEDKFPDRFLNVGIAEQNLIGIAAGLAESGMHPYVYTISNFLVHRCFEQIRNECNLISQQIVLLKLYSTCLNKAEFKNRYQILLRFEDSNRSKTDKIIILIFIC